MTARIAAAGDSGLLVELGDAIDVATNERAIGVAAAVRAAGIGGVRDVVSTFRSVAVCFDPLSTDIEALSGCLARACEASWPPVGGRLVEVPVTYGGDAGPDLDEAAGWAGVTPESFIARHASREYRVFMLGFLPGFAYMGIVDERIAAPRRGTPRLRVPAGSVGVAGRQTGVYPRESPGGWQLIGRTSLSLFDPNRTPVSVFSPGDRVRFVPVDDQGGGPGAPGERPALALPPQTSRSVTVIRPGLLTTIQDLGRWGHQARGVSVSGPMDPVAHRVANALVGNSADAATLEATILGPELHIDADVVIAVAGGDLGATLDGSPLAPGAVTRATAGGVLRFGERRRGARAYVAFGGGLDVPAVLGSRATHQLSALGGFGGRALRAGDRIPVGDQAVAPRSFLPVSEGSAHTARGGARVRVLPGPQDDYFEPAAFEWLQRLRFTISPQSDRMGYRLTGATVPRASREMISDATFVGGLQIPPSGEPILLMADRQTTGGYPQIATVITADLPAVGQLAPGDWIEFEVCTRPTAVAALAAQERAVLAGG